MKKAREKRMAAKRLRRVDIIHVSRLKIKEQVELYINDMPEKYSAHTA